MRKGYDMEKQEMFFGEIIEPLEKIRELAKDHRIDGIISLAVSADGYVYATTNDGGNTYSLSKCAYNDRYEYSVGKELET